MVSKLVLVVGVLGACTKPNPASCLDDFCSDPALPFCDVDGSIGGIPDTCIAIECTPGDFQGCRDDNELTCNETGTNLDETACEFGCGEEGCLPCNTSDCQPPEKHIIPEYVPAACDDLASTQFAVTEDLTIDTSDDANCTSLVQQPTGPEICVIHHESITIDPNRTLTVTGTRALALVADRGLDVEGILDASANLKFNGPGGGTIKSGGGGNNVAGGGAGNRTAGGAGGNASTNGGAANGGVAQPNPKTLSELFGGSQSIKATGGGEPGGSGGAVTLVCCRCELVMTGTIDVNGAGGGGGSVNVVGANVVNGSPGGGGSGGNVVLQGMQVRVEGQLFSNGGSGGSGAHMNNGSDEGREGLRSTTCVLAPTADAGAGTGGQGGCGLAGPGNGIAGTNNRAGAGGGSAGFLLIYTPEGVTPIVTPLVASPAFEPNDEVPTN